MGPISCPVCRAETGDTLAVCSTCETPHHPECWEFAGGCAVFACGQERARLTTRAQLDVPAEAPLYLDAEREPDVLEIVEPEPPPLRHRESDAVMLVSWLYLAASLVLAIPTAGWLVHGLTSAHPVQLAKALACGGAAFGLKHLGDLLAIGDRRGRTAHLYACLSVAAVSVSPGVTSTLCLLSVPFWTRRGRQHFARRR